MVTPQEYLLEVAKRSGLYARIKEEFLHGIDGFKPWHESICRRVALLRGVKEEVFWETAKQLRVRPGAVKLTKLLKARGWHVFIVTGGFTILEHAIKAAGITCDGFIAHELIFKDGVLDGCILTYKDKGEVARKLKETLNPKVTVAIGDGYNDIPMLREADLALGFRPKEIVRHYVDAEVRTFKQIWRILHLLS